jgi:hypothetical protein
MNDEQSERPRAAAGAPLRVDPAVLRAAAAEMARVADRVTDSCRGADGQVHVLAGRLGEEGGPVLDGWGKAGRALDVVEGDVRTVAQLLGVLADHFADLDRQAVAG